MDWLSQRVPNIERAIKPYGGEGETFKVDRKFIKDNFYDIIKELELIKSKDSESSYKDDLSIAIDDINFTPDDFDESGEYIPFVEEDQSISGSDFIDPRYFDRYRIPERNSGIPESDVVDPELPIRDSYAGPAISIEDADRLYNENINRKTPFNPNFLDDDYYTPRKRKDAVDIDPYINEDLSNMESGVFERENQRRKQAVSNDPSRFTPEEMERLKSMMSGERTPSTQAEIDYKKEFDNYETPKNAVDRNFLSKLKGQDYMGLLSDIGSYAARMAPLSTALAESGSYDTVRYPRFSPALPTAYTQKRDVGTAFNTARQAAMQQGKLDLGALSALATQQAQTIAGVEENVANERIGLLNQAQQLNNQVTMQEMADTAANKGAAATMKYQALAAMSEMGQGSLREANMRRNDQIVKQMFSNVFGDEFA
jgi:hypothetical protein